MKLFRRRDTSTKNGAATCVPVAAKGKKILIVDDSPVVRKALTLKLTSQGYEVIEIGDPSDALASVRSTRPHLILLDISFPPDVAHGGGVPWDGFLMMDWLRRVEEAKGVPIIVITGAEDEKIKARALEIGAAAFFRKPVEVEELLATIDRVLAKENLSTPVTAV